MAQTSYQAGKGNKRLAVILVVYESWSSPASPFLSSGVEIAFDVVPASFIPSSYEPVGNPIAPEVNSCPASPAD